MINPIDANAVDEFLRNGGRIQTLQEAVRVTEQEVVGFLESCGMTASYARSENKPYLIGEERFTADGLVDLANRERLARQLPPFALRSAPGTRRV
jgi:hypothetical protein